MFSWLNYEESKLLKEGQELLINQNIHGITTSTGEQIRTWNGDEIVFIKSINLNEKEKEHTFSVKFKSDILHAQHSGRPERYGEFHLTNSQVKHT